MTTPTRLAARALIRLSGEDVRGLLQGLVTNDVQALDAGPVWAALLTAQGKAQWDFILWPAPDGAGDDVLVDCEPGQADTLAKRLTMYRLRRPIAIARDEALGVHWSADGEGDPRLPALGRRWLGGTEGDAADDLFRAHRLRLGAPEGIAELGVDKTLWLETNAVELNGVSFTKGCYVGQENTARMNWRQKVNRRLAVLEVEDDPGEAARAYYPDLGLAVAPVRVEQLRSGGPIRLGTIEARPIVPDWLAAAIAEEPAR